MIYSRFSKFCICFKLLTRETHFFLKYGCLIYTKMKEIYSKMCSNKDRFSKIQHKTISVLWTTKIHSHSYTKHRKLNRMMVNTAKSKSVGITEIPLKNLKVGQGSTPFLLLLLSRSVVRSSRSVLRGALFGTVVVTVTLNNNKNKYT